jgi:hypothetical protein
MTMHIIINETGETCTLSSDAQDFIGSHGGLFNGGFTKDGDIYRCSKSTYDWWTATLEAEAALDDRIARLAAEHGQEPVWQIVSSIDADDLDTHAMRVNQALDEAFQTAEEMT